MTAAASDRQIDLKYFLESDDCNLLFFHDSVELVGELSEAGVLDKAHAYFSSSWFLNEEKFRNIKRYFSDASKVFGDVYDRVTILLNSKLEMDLAREIMPEVDTLHFNNASLINEKHFEILGQEKEFDVVYNARPNAFKRHHLTQQVFNKLFVAYEWKVTDVDLDSFNPAKIYWNLKGSEVGNAVSQARVGLLLSEEEGACYASTEYLLCGLPVISTASRGGRDEYYNEGNSLLCEATPESVKDCARIALEKLDDKSFDPEAIRNDCIKTMELFRDRLEQHMHGRLARAGVLAEPGLLSRRLPLTNKLWKYKNMRLTSIYADQRS